MALPGDTQFVELGRRKVPGIGDIEKVSVDLVGGGEARHRGGVARPPSEGLKLGISKTADGAC